ncbi:hypothetical protein WDU94_012939 [Cyamophila willieti]
MFPITEYHFNCLWSSIVLLGFDFFYSFLKFCDDDSCFAIRLEVFWTLKCPKPPMAMANEAQKLYSKFPNRVEHVYQISSKSDKAFES